MRADSSGFYLWEPEGKPVSIGLYRDLVDRLNFEVMRGFGAVPKRGAEIGGILLGTVDAGEKLVVRIEDFRCVPCEHLRGPSYVLSAADVTGLDAALNEWPAGVARRVVGFFRSNTRELLQLGEEDQALLDARFPDDGTVCLLIRPYTTRPNEAAFLIRESGAFPLEPQHEPFIFRQKEMTGGTSFPPGAPAGAAEAPAAASRQTSLFEFPSARTAEPWAAPPAPGGAGAGESLRGMDAAAEVPGGALTPFGDMAVAAAAAREARRSRRETGLSAPGGQDKAEQIRGAFADVRPAPPKQNRWVWLPLSFIFLLLGIVLGVEITLSMNRAQSMTQGGDPYSMELSVSRFGESYHLKWNPDLTAVRAARRGELLIQEGTATETKPLSADDLLRGGIIYRGTAQSVHFRLTLYLSDKTAISETVETSPAAP